MGLYQPSILIKHLHLIPLMPMVMRLIKDITKHLQHLLTFMPLLFINQPTTMLLGTIKLPLLIITLPGTTKLPLHLLHLLKVLNSMPKVSLENITTVILTLTQPNKNSKQLTVSSEELTATLMQMEFFKRSIMYLMPKGSKLLPLTCHKHL